MDDEECWLRCAKAWYVRWTCRSSWYPLNVRKNFLSYHEIYDYDSPPKKVMWMDDQILFQTFSVANRIGPEVSISSVKGFLKPLRQVWKYDFQKSHPPYGSPWSPYSGWLAKLWRERCLRMPSMSNQKNGCRKTRFVEKKSEEPAARYMKEQVQQGYRYPKALCYPKEKAVQLP